MVDRSYVVYHKVVGGAILPTKRPTPKPQGPFSPLALACNLRNPIVPAECSDLSGLCAKIMMGMRYGFPQKRHSYACAS